MHFTKVKEVFVNNTPRKENILQGLHRYHILGDIQLSWIPMLENKKIQVKVHVLIIIFWHIL